MSAPPQPIIAHRGPGRTCVTASFGPAHGCEIVANAEDVGAAQQSTIDGVPVVSFQLSRERLIDNKMIETALTPKVRHATAERIATPGGAFVTARPGDKAVSRTVTFGEGTRTQAGPLFIASLTTIGRHVIVVTPASIGHDCVIGDFVTINPSAALSGHIVIESDVMISVGAVNVNALPAELLRVGRGTLVRADAVITKSAPHALPSREILAGR